MLDCLWKIGVAGIKMISKSQIIYPVLVLMFSSLIFKNADAVANTISPGQQLSQSETIVSLGLMFELGFFSPADSMNYYVGIRYRDITEQPIVWLANRDFAVNASAVLRMNFDGNLEIRQGRILYEVTNITRHENATATLLDTGNFVLRDENFNILWQSFDFPANTFLPGMKLGYDRENGKSWSYVSWRSATDPSPGNFTLKLDPSPRGEKYVQIFNGDDWYKDIGPWTNGANLFNFTDDWRLSVYNFSFDADYLTYSLVNTSRPAISRFIIDFTGQFKVYEWLGTAWNLLYSQPGKICDVYAYCGANSTCTTNVSLQSNCSCLPGYEPNIPESWDSGTYDLGCRRKTELQCGNGIKGNGTGDGFQMLFNVVELPEKPLTTKVESIRECRSSCLSDCDCTAFSYIDNNCSIWKGPHLFNLQQDLAGNVSGRDFYLKLAAADLYTEKGTGKQRNNKEIIIISLTVSVTIFSSALAIWQARRKKHKRKGENLLSFELSISPTPTGNEQSQGQRQQKPSKDVEIPLFSFSSVSAATDKFSVSNKLGEGGFGPVYKGKSLKGNEVAIKRLSTKSGQGWDEFKNEAMLIAKLQHKNLVKLLGCCIEGDEKILVYEYLPNKSLDFFLFGSKNIFTLAWGTRVRIIEGIAQGLLYLHEFSRVQIIHRDLKASNILLDEDMNPKISDFGMARIFGGSAPRATDRIVGTYGYMAPEYALEGVFSVKSDVFSLGVLLLEILSGKKNTGFYQSTSLNLLGYAWDLWTSNKPLELLDTVMKDSSSANAAFRYVNIALLCVQENAADRPTMSDVVLMLSNELTILPSPSQPAFSNVRSMVNPNTRRSKPEIFSVNEVTISLLDAR